jgi:hypothetical protein
MTMLKKIGLGIRQGISVSLVCGIASPFVINLSEIVIDIINSREPNFVFILLFEGLAFIAIDAFLAYLWISILEGIVLEFSSSTIFKISLILFGSIVSSYYVWNPVRFSFLSETLIRLTSILMGLLYFYMFSRINHLNNFPRLSRNG